MIVLVTGWTRICAESGTCFMQTTRCMVSLQAPITCVPAFPLLASVTATGMVLTVLLDIVSSYRFLGG
ncbi:hypothetical protein CN059_30700 [Sinorhizobium medicae]|nr:hypothetical protein CN192_18450 [Sinorhizobium medicae]RVP94851.1 hypothetical protein CN070_29450 [Sinorhizobium meliloti]RVI88838.1 hypothetical protein CN186_28070 [Sinorhizobium medicae]RVI99409.1 hypothetical protein CN183_29015 [Sinorhizobium medicae]RVJ16359.1 hypothetical protein CN184_28910 [Sinorhizobium medicae]